MTNIQKIKVIAFVCITSSTIAQNTFTNLPNFPGSQRNAATSFSIGNVVYYATGGDETTEKNDLWTYNVSTGLWVEKQNMGAAPGRMMAASFALNGKGYLGTGKSGGGGEFFTDGSFLTDFYKYDPVQDSWTQISNAGSIRRIGAVGFAVNGKGYVALGSTNTGSTSNGRYFANIGVSTKTILELDPVTETWTERPFPSNFAGLISAASFVLNGKAYIAGGVTPAVEVGLPDQVAFSISTLQFDPVTYNWSLKAPMPFSTHTAAAFSALDRGYIVGGNLANSTGGIRFPWTSLPISNKVLKYNPTSNQWTTLSITAPQSMTWNAASSVCENGIISTGAFRSSTNQNDIANLQFTPDVDEDYIVGSNNICSSFDTPFSLQLSAAGTVTWTTSPNIFINSGQGTKSVNVRSNASGQGWIQASINLGCRVVTFPQKAAWAGSPPANNSTLIWLPGMRGINPVQTSSGGAIYNFNVDAVPNASSYTWVPPRGFVVIGSRTTVSPSISITTSATSGTYTLLCSANNVCGSNWTSSLTINNSSGGGGIQQRVAITAFPNPATEAVSVNLKEVDSKEEAQVALLNKNMERVFFTQTIEKEISIPVSNLPEGIYFLKIQIGKEVTDKQVIVKH